MPIRQPSLKLLIILIFLLLLYFFDDPIGAKGLKKVKKKHNGWKRIFAFGGKKKNNTFKNGKYSGKNWKWPASKGGSGGGHLQPTRKRGQSLKTELEAENEMMSIERVAEPKVDDLVRQEKRTKRGWSKEKAGLHQVKKVLKKRVKGDSCPNQRGANELIVAAEKIDSAVLKVVGLSGRGHVRRKRRRKRAAMRGDSGQKCANVFKTVGIFMKRKTTANAWAKIRGTLLFLSNGKKKKSSSVKPTQKERDTLERFEDFGCTKIFLDGTLGGWKKERSGNMQILNGSPQKPRTNLHSQHKRRRKRDNSNNSYHSSSSPEQHHHSTEVEVVEGEGGHHSSNCSGSRSRSVENKIGGGDDESESKSMDSEERKKQPRDLRVKYKYKRKKNSNEPGEEEEELMMHDIRNYVRPDGSIVRERLTTHRVIETIGGTGGPTMHNGRGPPPMGGGGGKMGRKRVRFDDRQMNAGGHYPRPPPPPPPPPPPMPMRRPPPPMRPRPPPPPMPMGRPLPPPRYGGWHGKHHSAGHFNGGGSSGDFESYEEERGGHYGGEAAFGPPPQMHWEKSMYYNGSRGGGRSTRKVMKAWTVAKKIFMVVGMIVFVLFLLILL